MKGCEQTAVATVRRVAWRGRSLVLSLCVAVAVTACGRGRVEQGVERPDNMGPADLHTIQSAELERLMQTLNLTLYEREATPLDIDAERLRQAEMLAGLLGMISKELVALAAGDEFADLTPDERQLFLQHAEELAAHGRDFNTIALSGSAEEFAPAMNRTVKTCNACHDRFRDM